MRALRVAAGGRYDLVWRTRPDVAWVSSREAGLPALLDALLRPSPSVPMVRPYLIPSSGWLEGYPTDQEAILPVASGAADRYSLALDSVPALYTRSRTLFLPEALLHEHMRAGGFTPAVRHAYKHEKLWTVHPHDSGREGGLK